MDTFNRHMCTVFNQTDTSDLPTLRTDFRFVSDATRAIQSASTKRSKLNIFKPFLPYRLTNLQAEALKCDIHLAL